MHIPDGFVDVKTAAVTAGLSAAGLGLALRQTRVNLPPWRVPLMGLAAAFVFAAQMLNFPVYAGTSGHLVGGVLAAVLLGPSAATVVLAAVLIVQCFLFSDGGVSALGANIFNMAIVGTVGGYAIYATVTKVFGGLRGKVMGAAFAAWCSTVLAAICCTGELVVSKKISWSVGLPFMTGIHMLIGVGEGIITALVLAGIARTRPEMLEQPVRQLRGFDVIVPNPVPAGPLAALPIIEKRKKSLVPFVVYSLLICLGLALFISPLASKWPDGLDRAAEMLHFKSPATTQPMVSAPLPEYQFPGIHSQTLATSIAGAIGTVAVFVLAWALARALVPKERGTNTDSIDEK